MIPLATRTITISRRQIQYEKYYESDEDYAVINEGVGAHIYSAGGSVSNTEPGSTVTKTTRLICDPCDLQVGDHVTDDSNGDVYDVISTTTIDAFLPQTLAQLQMVSRT